MCLLQGGTKTLSASQLQLYRQQQAILRHQQQQQLRVLQARGGTVAGQKVSVAVSPSSATQRVQQVVTTTYCILFKMC